MTARLRGDGRVVGRDGERARLLRLARTLTHGTGGVGVVVGPAGVGKSRLVDDVAERIDATVLRVRAAEALVELPFAGLVRALAPVQRSPAWRSLVEGLPRLHALWPGDVPASVGTADPELERAALVYAVAEVFRRLARRGPVLLVLDDAHWIDRASLDVLAQLAPAAEDHPLLVLATVRSDVADPERHQDGRAGSGATAWADGWPAVERVGLARLSDDLTAAMVADLVGSDPPPELLDVVRERAAGVPLYVRALVFALAETGALRHDGRTWAMAHVPSADTPATVRQLVLDRLALRGEADRTVVRTVAVAGDAVPHDVLAAVADLPPQELVGVLARLIAAGLVIEEARDEVVYRVEHPLVRSALADSVGALARRRLHARLFDAFTERHPTASHDQARHAVAAGSEVDPDRALPVVLDVLRSTAALDDAVDLALAAHRLALRGPAPTASLVEALELLGQAYESGDDRERAGAAWDNALRYANELASDTVARLHRRRALLAWDRLEVDLARRHLHHALAAGPDGPERAAALHARLLFADRGADPTTVADAVEELRRIRGDPDRDPAEAMLGHCWAELNAGRFHTARLAAQAALSSESARHDPDPEIARRAHLELTLVCWMLGDHAALAAHAEQATAVDPRFAGPALRAQTEFRLGIASVMAGDPARAVDRLRPAVAAAEGAGFHRVGVACSGVLAAALALAGDLPAARRALRGARAAAREVAGSRAMLLVDWAAGVVAVDGCDGVEGGEVDDVEAVVPREWHHFPPFAALAVRHAYDRGDLEGLHQLHRTISDSDGPYAATVERVAAGLVTRGRSGPEAVPILQRAAAGFDALDLPRDAAIARLHAGDVASLLAARDAFRRLGDHRWATRSRVALRAAGVSAASLRDRPGGEASLTPRELEVARLVAAGHTSARVARELGVSVRTVTSHLEHIYRRLELHSRAALATWLHHLDTAPPR